ncbi:LysM domain-containing protein [uncultured Clostridium sp.]|uniref:LysM peptidoglycan-binding domain-containing protein n=1 Tax=uncultured Clostridium sp. TaxID=59620 RepID=UPI0028EEE002|nr:LysM domain-containing protein [uncultured Clostridium sp.]
MFQCPTRIFPYTIKPNDTLWLLAQRYYTTVYAIASLNPGIDLNNLYIGQVIYICPGYRYYCQNFNPVPKGISKAEATLSNHLRMLWEQHVVWTRLTILSMVFNLPDVELVTNRLLRNPKDFEAALRPFYGDKNASKFADLFTQHLVIAAELVKAANAGDNKTAADAEKRWYANADEIAAFLASINPYWSEEDWKKMLHEHLALTKSEAVAMITKNYAEGIKLFDKIEKQALEMADMMTQGIVKQFPNSFTQ